MPLARCLMPSSVNDKSNDRCWRKVFLGNHVFIRRLVLLTGPSCITPKKQAFQSEIYAADNWGQHPNLKNWQTMGTNCQSKLQLNLAMGLGIILSCSDAEAELVLILLSFETHKGSMKFA